MPESAAGDARQCGQSKCAKDARAFQLERSATRSVPHPKSATADPAIVETKIAGGNALVTWERCKGARRDSARHFRASAQLPLERIVSDR